MTTSELKAKFARLGPTRAVDLAQSGSRELVTIIPQPNRRERNSIAAILLLRRCGASMLEAKRSIEAVLHEGRVVVDIPCVPDAAVFFGELAEHGFEGRIRSREAPDVQLLRERLSLTQEQFAARFGLDVDAIRSWERSRRVPDAAARSLLKVIARFPDVVAEAQDG